MALTASINSALCMTILPLRRYLPLHRHPSLVARTG
jgi:hypothetical protein